MAVQSGVSAALGKVGDKAALKRLKSLAKRQDLQGISKLLLSGDVYWPLDDPKIAQGVCDVCGSVGAEALLVTPRLLPVHANAAFTLRRYSEAWQSISAARDLESEYSREPLLRRNRLDFEIECLLAMSEPQRAVARFHELLALIERRPELATCHQYRLGVRACAAAGNDEDALSWALQATACARGRAQEAWCQALACRLRLRMVADSSEVIECLLPLAASLDQDAGSDEELRRGQTELKLCLATAFFMQGKLRQARRVLGPASRPVDLATAELSVLHAVSAFCRGDLSQALRVLRDTTGCVMNGHARSEQASLLFGQGLLLAACGGEREALQIADELYDLLAACGGSGHTIAARCLLASCLLQRGDCRRARRLITEVVSETVVHTDIEGNPLIEENPLAADNRFLMSFGLLVAALCELGEGKEEQARNLLTRHADMLHSPDCVLLLALMCFTHRALFSLLLQTTGVDALTPELTDLLDNHAFGETFAAATGDLSTPELQRLRRRFERVGALRFRNSDESPVELALFGGLQLRAEGQLLDLGYWRNNKARTILLALGCARGQELSRDYVCELLWPRRPAMAVRNNFYVAWSSMLRVLSAALPESLEHVRLWIREAFVASSGRCVMRRELVVPDVQLFEDELSSCDTVLAEGREEEALRHVRAVARLYRGELLPADLYLDWLEEPRARCHAQFCDAMALGASLCLKRGDGEGALFFVNRALACETQNETLYELAMRAYAMVGRREEALLTYRKCCLHLVEELGLDPSARLRGLYKELICDG
ncbi:MAG: hypothetical protein LBJ07_00050 [Actinomycetes bacterium]|jgi:DNA-binding SARP family transcriptional activator|nr:hypothetical protein [Actinomycetes bacterium]